MEFGTRIVLPLHVRKLGQQAWKKYINLQYKYFYMQENYIEMQVYNFLKEWFIDMR